MPLALRQSRLLRPILGRAHRRCPKMGIHHHFPREVLFNLEKEIRLLDTLSVSLDKLTFSNAVSRIQANLRAWLDQPGGSQHLCFDNLGLTGAVIYDLYTRTSANSAEYIRQATSGPGGPNAAIRLETLGDLHISLNARFTLNPAQSAEFADFTPLDWVKFREPEILAVQIGHNHGLFSVGFSAEDKGITNGDPIHGGYFDQWQKLADGLAALPDTVQTILVTMLPKVGATANLKPRGDERLNGYAPFYEPVLSTHTTVFLGPRLREIDQEIKHVNQQIQGILTNAAKATGNPGREKRLVFLDTWDLLDKRDYKNTCKRCPASRWTAASLSTTATSTASRRLPSAPSSSSSSSPAASSASMVCIPRVAGTPSSPAKR